MLAIINNVGKQKATQWGNQVLKSNLTEVMQKDSCLKKRSAVT